MIEIPLTQGRVALIDDEDAHLAAFKWCLRKDGLQTYAHRFVMRDGKRTTELLHRAVLNASPGDRLVDHRNGNGLDCRRGNLRFSTRSANARNRSSARSDNRKSPYMGVSWVARTGKFSARIKADGKTHYLGQHATAEIAHAARLAAERALWGVEPQRAALHGEPR